MAIHGWTETKASVAVAWPTGEKGDLTYLRHETKRLIWMAGLPDDLSFSSFRHSGLTEGGDADVTDREIFARSTQKAAIRQSEQPPTCQNAISSRELGMIGPLALSEGLAWRGVFRSTSTNALSLLSSPTCWRVSLRRPASSTR